MERTGAVFAGEVTVARVPRGLIVRPCRGRPLGVDHAEQRVVRRRRLDQVASCCLKAPSTSAHQHSDEAMRVVDETGDGKKSEHRGCSGNPS
ncbi:hypothetical protein [Amycolatopsis sp. cmx-11-12]|uniref:hypothetical protein n=1 Tax=Amycolatopsis sp. cmx-11-12 TaxID=2785795 RepID=UPI003917D8AF